MGSHKRTLEEFESEVNGSKDVSPKDEVGSNSNSNGYTTYQASAPSNLTNIQEFRAQCPQISALPLQELFSHRQGLADFRTLLMPTQSISTQQSNHGLPHLPILNGHSLMQSLAHTSLTGAPLTGANTSEPFIPQSLPSPFGLNFGQPIQQPIGFSVDDGLAAAIKAATTQIPSAPQIAGSLPYQQLFCVPGQGAMGAASAGLRGHSTRAGVLQPPLVVPPLAGYTPSVIESLRAAAAASAVAAVAPDPPSEDIPPPPAAAAAAALTSFSANGSGGVTKAPGHMATW